MYLITGLLTLFNLGVLQQPDNCAQHEYGYQHHEHALHYVPESLLPQVLLLEAVEALSTTLGSHYLLVHEVHLHGGILGSDDEAGLLLSRVLTWIHLGRDCIHYLAGVVVADYPAAALKSHELVVALED